jgi:SAM-dependent methyltransferase
MIDAIIATCALPLKFAYTGPAAQAHLRLAELDSYKEITFAAGFEAGLAKDLMREIDLDIVDIGPGDGQHSVCFLQELQRKGQTVSKYLGLDFSNELMKIAGQRMKTTIKNTRASFRYWDVEVGMTEAIHTWRGDASTPLLVTLFGQTLGNFDNSLQVLQNIRRSVKLGDQLMLSVALQIPGNSTADYLRPYQNSIFMEAIAEPLRMCGLSLARGRLFLAYEDDAIIGKFVLRYDQTVEHQQIMVILPKDTVIRCFRSRRFLYEDIEPMLHKAGWKLAGQGKHNKGAIGAYFARAC